jgi:hypothetical protein
MGMEKGEHDLSDLTQNVHYRLPFSVGPSGSYSTKLDCAGARSR